MSNLQDLIDQLDELEVEPRELPLTGREFRLLAARAENISDSDTETED